MPKAPFLRLKHIMLSILQINMFRKLKFLKLYGALNTVVE